jgi:hypothetical protein
MTRGADAAFAGIETEHDFAERDLIEGNGRGGEIRTHDLYVPNVALYQAKLRPDTNFPV